MSARIYVACLASYNNGLLHGKWLDVPSDKETLLEAIQQEVLATSPERDAEEWAIHDYDGFEGIRVSEYHDLEELCAYSEMLEDKDYPSDVIAEVYNIMGFSSPSETIPWMQDNFAGISDTLENWCEEFLEDCGGLNEVPESLKYYIDIEKYARDMDYNGEIQSITADDGDVYVFWNR